MFKRNNQAVDINRDLTIGDGDDAITYPAASLQDAALRAELGIVDVIAQARPDDRYYWVDDNGDGTFNARPKDVDQLRAIKTDEIAAARYNIEVGGIRIGGVEVKTDRESQAQLSSAYTSLAGGLISDTPWKAANGWVNVTLTEIAPIAQAVAVHVRSAFAWEQAQQEALAALGDDAEALISFRAAPH